MKKIIVTLLIASLILSTLLCVFQMVKNHGCHDMGTTKMDFATHLDLVNMLSSIGTQTTLFLILSIILPFFVCFFILNNFFLQRFLILFSYLSPPFLKIKYFYSWSKNYSLAPPISFN